MLKKQSVFGLLIILLAVTTACGPGSTSAPATPAITFISPKNGQTVSLDNLTLEVESVENAEGYAWTISQYGVTLWDSFENRQKLTGPRYEIPGDSGLAQRAVSGVMTIQVRARLDGKWTDYSEITVVITVPTNAPEESVTAAQPEVSSTPVASSQGTVPSILFSGGGKLYALDPEVQEVIVLIEGMENINTLAVDETRQVIYMNSWEHLWWLPLANPIQQRPNYLQPMPFPGFMGGQGMAIDFQSNRIFMGVYYSGVYTRTLGQDNWEQIVSFSDIAPLLGQRGQLQVDPANRHVYFRTAFNGDCGECRWIYRVDYDGRNLTKIVRANGGDALALDLQAGKIYYSDMPGNATIKRANLNGTNIETLLSITDNDYGHCWRMEIDRQNDKIYLAMEDSAYDGKQTIARMNLDGSDFKILFLAEYGKEKGGQGSIFILSGSLPAISSGSPMPSPTLVQTPSPTSDLPGCAAGWSRLKIGDGAVVLPGDPNRVRSEPRKGDNVIGKLYPTMLITILEGPVCSDGLVFWKVENATLPGGYGWTAEGDGKEYWLEPYKEPAP